MINKQNSQRSTGPRTAEGRTRSSLNALRHGATAQRVVLPGEERAAFDQQLEAWTEALKPEDHAEECVVEEIVQFHWQQKRIRRAQSASLEPNMLRAADREKRQRKDEILALGDRLFFDRLGPAQK